jgi:two-component system, sensor histidine kinase and response regulator
MVSVASTAPDRLLIVDDEPRLMTALRDTLCDQGYDVTGFTEPAEALAALRGGNFDLLLTDLMMPAMDGIALLRAAREIDPQVVGIVMTGQGTISTAVEAMKVGAFDYVLKPFKLAEIKPVLTRAIDVRRLRVKNAELERRVQERTAELEASNKELESFAYSVSHDLRAPLRAIGGFSTLLLENHATELSAPAQHLLGTVTESAKRMSQLIEDLLRFSRLGRQSVSRRPVDMQALVPGVLQEIEQREPEHRVQARVGTLPGVIGDEACFGRFSSTCSRTRSSSRDTRRHPWWRSARVATPMRRSSS